MVRYSWHSAECKDNANYIFDDTGFVGDDYVAAGIIWATYNGVKAMNNSWGGWGYSHTLKAAFDYALDHNVVVMVSAVTTTLINICCILRAIRIIEVAAVEYNGSTKQHFQAVVMVLQLEHLV